MTSAPVESRPWSRRRWWGMVALVFGVQLALIFWLGDRTPVHPRRRPPRPRCGLADNGSPTAGTQRSHAVRPAASAGVFRAGVARCSATSNSTVLRWVGAAALAPVADAATWRHVRHFMQTNDFNFLPAPAQFGEQFINFFFFFLLCTSTRCRYRIALQWAGAGKKLKSLVWMK